MASKRPVTNMNGWHSLAIKIEHLCRYITDDGTIAAYFAIDRAQVAKVRKTMHRSEFIVDRIENALSSKPGDTSGVHQQQAHATSARLGSERLRDKTIALIEKYQAAERIPFPQALNELLYAGELR